MITMDEKGLMMSRAIPDPATDLEYFIVCFTTYKEMYKQLLSWRKKMLGKSKKSKFMDFLDDIVTTVIDNCEVEEVEWTEPGGEKMGDYEITPKAGMEGKLLSVIKKHLDKVE